MVTPTNRLDQLGEYSAKVRKEKEHICNHTLVEILLVVKVQLVPPAELYILHEI